MTALSRTGARRSYFKSTEPEELLGVEVLHLSLHVCIYMKYITCAFNREDKLQKTSN